MNASNNLIISGFPDPGVAINLKKSDVLKAGDPFRMIHDEMKIESETTQEKKTEEGSEVCELKNKKTASSGTIPAYREKERKVSEREVILDIRPIESALRHHSVFMHFDALNQGEGFYILTDNDPEYLKRQLEDGRGNIFSWDSYKTGPDLWKIEISKRNITQFGETVGEIAAKSLHKAEVLKKYGIDFCCGGKRTLKQVCEEQDINIHAIETDLNKPINESIQSVNDFNGWNADFLADYIYNQHHLYYYRQAPVIKELMIKVAGHHEAHYSYLAGLSLLFSTLQNELDTHFAHEEKTVFPLIKALVLAEQTTNTEAIKETFSVKDAISLMESDHEAAGGILEAMNQLTSEYVPPDDACNNFILLYKKLQALEADLHQHIHLENNILFPKALRLEEELKLSQRQSNCTLSDRSQL
jgi:regulator of cell morphogenesis and NO signaling